MHIYKENAMILYVVITICIFLILLMGLRPDSVDAANSWPYQPDNKLYRANKVIVNTITFAAIIVLWGLTAFRSSAIGNDTSNYLYYFRLFETGPDPTSRIEIGYQWLNFFINKISNDRHVFLIIMASLMYGALSLYIFKYSKNPAVSLCLLYSLFFSVFISMLRQGGAMIIVLIGYQFLKDGKKLPAALLFLLATTLHTTAVVSFLLFLDLKFLKNKWLVIGLTVFCASISFTGVLKGVVNLVVPRYTGYFEGQYASSGWLAISYYLISYIVLFWLVSDSFEADRRDDTLAAVNFTLLLLLTAFGYAVNLFERAGEYYSLIAVTEFPNLLYRGKVKHFRIWLFCICTVFLIMFLITLLLRPDWNHLYPYEFWPDSVFAALN